MSVKDSYRLFWGTELALLSRDITKIGKKENDNGRMNIFVTLKDSACK